VFPLARGVEMSARSVSQALFEPGVVVGGRFRIISLIGTGGVGRVYLARHIELDTEVAIKVLRPEMADRPEAVLRFGREARASVRLSSERIARVLDVGNHEGEPYFVMEYMVGSNLLEYRRQANVDIATLCEFFIQACEGLADAHSQGVVHRDVKSENLFIVRDASGWRSLKIFDFGISKFSLTGRFSDTDLASMRTETMMGTPHYISPEQIRSSRTVDHRTDLWSLGAVMFEVLSGGILPFREDRDVTALVAEVLEMPHRSLLDVAPNVPERLAAIVDRCLVKDRDQRYQTAAEIALDLLPLAPVRARASAERAVLATQAAGMMAVNGDMESLRPMPTTLSDRPKGGVRRTPTPSDEPNQGPSSGLRRSEPPFDAAPSLPEPPLVAANLKATLPAKPMRSVSVSGQTAATDMERAIQRTTLPAPTDQGKASPLSADGALEGGAPKRRRSALWLVALAVASIAVLLFAQNGSGGRGPAPMPRPSALAVLPTVTLEPPRVPPPVLVAPASVAVEAEAAPRVAPRAATPKVAASPRPALAPKASAPKSEPSPSSPVTLDLIRER